MQNNMGTLKFSDGVEINTSGKLRPLRLKDGWYAVGNGMCIPMSTAEEVQKFIDKHASKAEEEKIEIRDINDAIINTGDVIEWTNLGVNERRKGTITAIRETGIYVTSVNNVQYHIRPPFDAKRITIIEFSSDKTQTT